VTVPYRSDSPSASIGGSPRVKIHSKRSGMWSRCPVWGGPGKRNSESKCGRRFMTGRRGMVTNQAIYRFIPDGSPRRPIPQSMYLSPFFPVPFPSPALKYLMPAVLSMYVGGYHVT
jgi:hypothetical protein